MPGPGRRCCGNLYAECGFLPPRPKSTGLSPDQRDLVRAPSFRKPPLNFSNQRIPLAKLQSAKRFIVEGQRLEVNPSVDRYKKEVANLTAAL